jgi:transposase
MGNAIIKFEKHGIFEDLKRSGRPKALSERNVRELKRLVTGENRLSVAKITSDINISLPKPVSKDTIRRCLTKLGYEYAVKLKKPWLSVKHKKSRVKWCKQHQHWTIHDWRKYR